MRRGLILGLVLGLAVSFAARAGEQAPPLGLLLLEGERALLEGRYEDALGVYRRALSWYPQEHDVHSGMGLSYLGLGQHRAALEHLMPLVTARPLDFIARNNAAWIYATTSDENVRDPRRAVRLAQEAMLLAPQNHNVHSTLAAAHHAAGNHDRAVRAIEQAIRLARVAQAPPQEIHVYQDRLRQYRQAREAAQGT